MKNKKPNAERAVFERLDGNYEIVLIPVMNPPYEYIETGDGRIGKLRKVNDKDILFYEEQFVETNGLF